MMSKASRAKPAGAGRRATADHHVKVL